MTPAHNLVLIAGTGSRGTCGCGEEFSADTYTALVKTWETHTIAIPLLAEAHDAIQREYDARLQGEDAIRTLLALGVSSTVITDAIGAGADDKPLISKTVIQRLGREDYVKTPRRRRRA